MVDWRKILEAALIPTLAIVVVGIIGGLGSSSVDPITAIGIFALMCLVLLYSGYNATKMKLDLVSAALVGAITGSVFSIINGIISIIALVFSSLTRGTAGSAFVWLYGLFAIAPGVVLGSAVGAVLGAIGGFIGQKIEPKQS